MLFKNLQKFFSITQVPNLRDFLSKEQNFLKQNHTKSIYNNIKGLKFFIKTYGCQMNQSDSEIINSILQQHKLTQVSDIKESNLCIINTCAIRENAEQKIWTYISHIKYLKKERKKQGEKFYIGVVGCMAERLKQKLVEKEKQVDLIIGPDSYKDLPRLIDYLNSPLNQSQNNYAINTQLSIDETYSDVTPIRTDGVKAMISIMRGCANICSFCIVPFVRGVERSRSVESIIKEVQQLQNQGIKEVTLLGQNVNSYFDQSKDVYIPHKNSEGFNENYKARDKKGLRFAQLLQQLAVNFPEIRFRFTSPHPKDFPDQVIQVIKEYPNICSQLHMPAQSGSDQILEKMNRKYTQNSYLKLVNKVKQLMPRVSLSSDFIVGFCDESEEDFLKTLEIIEQCKFDQSFNFAYSMREKTPAFRTLKDNVPANIKQQRLERLTDLFKKYQLENMQKLIGSYQLILVENEDLKKSRQQDYKKYFGKADNGKVTIFKKPENIDINPGDYIKVKVTHVTHITLFGNFIEKSSIQKFSQDSNNQPYYYQLILIQ